MGVPQPWLSLSLLGSTFEKFEWSLWFVELFWGGSKRISSFRRDTKRPSVHLPGRPGPSGAPSRKGPAIRLAQGVEKRRARRVLSPRFRLSVFVFFRFCFLVGSHQFSPGITTMGCVGSRKGGMPVVCVKIGDSLPLEPATEPQEVM